MSDREDFDRLVAAALDGRLDGAERERFVAALADPALRRRLRELGDLEGLLGEELGRAGAPAALQLRTAPPRGLRRARRRPLVLAACALAAGLLALAPALLREDRGGVDRPDGSSPGRAAASPLAAASPRAGDRFETGDAGLELLPGPALRCALAPRSRAELRAVGLRPGLVLGAGAARLQLANGEALLTTPHATIALTAIDLAVAIAGDRTLIAVLAGSQSLAAGERSLALGPDQVASIGGDGRAVVESEGRGLRVEYFAGKDLTGFAWAGIDRVVSHTWTGRAPVPTLGQDRWSARWSGWLVPRQDGTHRIELRVDDGARLWLDERLAVDDWTVQGAVVHRVDLDLRAGRPYRLRLDYFQEIRQAELTLAWTTPDGRRETVPEACLHPPNAFGSP